MPRKNLKKKKRQYKKKKPWAWFFAGILVGCFFTYQLTTDDARDDLRVALESRQKVEVQYKEPGLGAAAWSILMTLLGKG